MFIDIRQRLQMASGDLKFSPDQEDAIAFVTTTSRKAAITVREGWERGKGRCGRGGKGGEGERGEREREGRERGERET